MLEPGVDPDALAGEANRQLADHQKIRRALSWPEPELPRTEGTRKLKRAPIRDWVKSGGDAAAGARGTGSAGRAASRGMPGASDIAPATTLEELGLSSLERVELMVALEDAFQTRIDEGAFSAARDVSSAADARRTGRNGLAGAQPSRSSSRRGTGAGRRATLRRLSLPTWILPLARVFARITVEGREHLKAIDRPVIFAANHQSHMDTPVILAALPARLRYRVAPAMAKEFFKAHFFPEQHTAGRHGSPTASTTTWPRSSSTRSRCRSAKPARGRRSATSASCWRTASRC